MRICSGIKSILGTRGPALQSHGAWERGYPSPRLINLQQFVCCLSYHGGIFGVTKTGWAGFRLT